LTIALLQNGLSWRKNATGQLESGYPLTNHTDDQDIASNFHWQICKVANQPGASEPDWLELMLEVLPRGHKQHQTLCTFRPQQ